MVINCHTKKQQKGKFLSRSQFINNIQQAIIMQKELAKVKEMLDSKMQFQRANRKRCVMNSVREEREREREIEL